MIYLFIFIILTMDFINVYIDGSCVNNGKENACAGYGVYFKENDEKNEYGRVEENKLIIQEN